MGRVYRTAREWPVPAPVDVVWALMADVDGYRSRWPWLRRFEGERLATGERWWCTIKPPLPYMLSFSLDLHDVAERRSVAATLDGDIVGTAEVHLAAVDAADTRIRLVSALEAAHPMLRAVTVIAPRVAQWGHDRVLEAGLTQFAAACRS